MTFLIALLHPDGSVSEVVSPAVYDVIRHKNDLHPEFMTFWLRGRLYAFDRVYFVYSVLPLTPESFLAVETRLKPA